MKRIMIAGTGIGCGKSTITSALVQALADRNSDVSFFKCGPDYIDPLFCRTVIGAPAYNLDSLFYDENTLKYLFSRSSHDISIIEGIAGFYDGISFTEKGSSYEISKITDTPVVLVVNASGTTNSAAAIIKGFMSYDKNNIKGVIFNNITAHSYEHLKPLCNNLKIKPLGYFPHIENPLMESRYLGLVSDSEIDAFKNKMSLLSKTAEKYIDIDGLIGLCSESKLKYCPVKIDKIADVRIAVAYDKAFCFYYKSSMELLEELGAELVHFSPLNDQSLPDDIDGIFLGGGYPELYAEKLEANTDMLESIRSAIIKGMPCIAECGGFMYLHEYMGDFTNKQYKGVGVIPKGCYKEETPQNNGHVKLMALKDNILCKKGESINAYEFHYFRTSSNGDAFLASTDAKTWECIVAEGNLFAGFPHMHFYSNPNFARNFIHKCIAIKSVRTMNQKLGI